MEDARLRPSTDRSQAGGGGGEPRLHRARLVGSRLRPFLLDRYDSIDALARNAKVFTWEGDPDSADAWRAAGFHPVVLSATDIVPSLQTGLINTVAMAPLYAFSSRAFEKARYMIDLP